MQLIELRNQTLILAVLSIVIAKISRNKVVGASLAYWFGWLFLEIGAYISLLNGWTHSLDSLHSYSLLSEMHIGAFIGFTLATLVSSVLNSKNKRYSLFRFERTYSVSIEVSKIISTKLLYAIFFLGLIFLLERVQRVGLSMDYFSDARKEYLHREFNIFSWLSTHLFNIIMFVLILFGIEDGKSGLNISRFLKVLLASAPMFLANATRTFLLGPLMMYLASFILFRASARKGSLFERSELIKLSTLVMVLLIAFASIGFIRGGYGDEFNLFYTILIWPVSTVNSLDDWVYAAIQSSGTNGLLTFDWLSSFLHNRSIIDFTEEKRSFYAVLEYFQSTHNAAAVVPRSILPDIIFDFGAGNVLLVSTIMAFVLQLITDIFSGKNVFLHTLAVVAFIGAFRTIQNSFFTPSVAILLFWSLIFHFKYGKRI